MKDIDKIKQRFSQTEIAKSTIQQYLSHIKQFWKWAEEEGKDIQNEPPEKLITEFTEHYNHRTLATNGVAVSALLKYYRKILHKSVDKELITTSGQETNYKPIVFTRDQVAEFFNHIHTSWKTCQQAMAHVAWDGALRASELVKIKQSQVTLTSQEIRDVKVEKTRKDRRKDVPLSQKTIELLKQYSPPRQYNGDYLFATKQGEYFRRWVSSEWSSTCGKTLRELFDVPENHSHTVHNFFRNTRLTHLAEDTESFLKVMQVSGHVQPSNAYKYFKNADVEIPETEIFERR